MALEYIKDMPKLSETVHQEWQQVTGKLLAHSIFILARLFLVTLVAM